MLLCHLRRRHHQGAQRWWWRAEEQQDGGGHGAAVGEGTDGPIAGSAVLLSSRAATSASRPTATRSSKSMPCRASFEASALVLVPMAAI